MPIAQIIAFCEKENIDIKSITAEKLIEIYPNHQSSILIQINLK